MRLAVSNIAWERSDDDRLAEVLCAAGIDAVELAPTKAWPDLQEVDVTAAAQEAARWRHRGLEVLSTQALLFGRPDLQLFGSKNSRECLIGYLEHVLALGAAMGAQAQVFGSPRNRRREGLPASEAMDIAVGVFSRLALTAEGLGTTLVIEANPWHYGADFLTSAHDAAHLVHSVDRPGFRLHLDTACMLLAGDDPVECVRAYAPLLAHVHLSEPELGPVGAPSAVHADFVAALQEAGYDGGLSVEMRPAADPSSAVRVAADYAVRLLGVA